MRIGLFVRLCFKVSNTINTINCKVSGTFGLQNISWDSGLSAVVPKVGFSIAKVGFAIVTAGVGRQAVCGQQEGVPGGQS